MIHRASSDSRNTQAPARSAGVPMRLSGIVASSPWMIVSSTVERVASVSVGPGAMALTRMFIGPSSRANDPVIPCSASLAIP